MSLYQPTIPTGFVDLDVDYQNIQDNFQQLDTTYAVDHFAFSDQSSQNGIHKQVRLLNQAAPGVGFGNGALYANSLSGNSWPVWQNALGSTQILGAPTNNSGNGFASLPGGILFQWGKVINPNSTSGTQNFNTPFLNPTSVINVSFTLARTSSSSDSIWINTSGSNTEAHFSWKSSTSLSAATDFFYWTAIGRIL